MTVLIESHEERTERTVFSGICDFHAHLACREYVRMLTSAGIRPPGLSESTVSVTPDSGDDTTEAFADRIRLMNEAGVQVQIISPSLAPYLSTEATAVQAATLINNRCSSMMRSHSSRIEAFISLPLPHIDAALVEMRRGFDALGMVGVCLNTAYLELSIVDERFAPLFDEMERRRAILFLHPCVNGLHSPLLNDWGLAACAGPLLEDSTVAMHLIAKNIPFRYPNIRIILAHLGGGLAGMLERLDNQMPRAIKGLLGRPSDMARRFWYDTVSHGSAAALRCAVDAFGAERIVPGSDFPYLTSYEPYRRTFSYIRDALREHEAVKILRNNAALLRIRP